MMQKLVLLTKIYLYLNYIYNQSTNNSVVVNYERRKLCPIVQYHLLLRLILFYLIVVLIDRTCLGIYLFFSCFMIWEKKLFEKILLCNIIAQRFLPIFF